MAQQNLPDIPVSPETLTQLTKQVGECHAMLTELREEWQANKPVLEAFRRGGVLAARTAARHQRREDARSG